MTSECITSLLNKHVGRHVKQGKTCAVKGVGPKCSTLKPSNLLSVTACQGKAAVCQGLKSCLPTYLLLKAVLIYTGTPGIVPRVYPYLGYCAEGLGELTEVPGTGIKPLQNSQKFRVLRHGRTELTEVPGRYNNVVPVPRVL